MTVNFQHRLILCMRVLILAQKLLNTRRLPRRIFFQVTFVPFCIAVQEGMVDKIGFHGGPVVLRFCIERNGVRSLFLRLHWSSTSNPYSHLICPSPALCDLCTLQPHCSKHFSSSLKLFTVICVMWRNAAGSLARRRTQSE